MTTQEPEEDQVKKTWKSFARVRRRFPFIRWKRRGKNKVMDNEHSPLLLRKQPQETESVNVAEELAVRLKWEMQLVGTSDALPDRGDIIVPEDDRTSDPRLVRIRSRGGDNRFMTVDRSRQKPRMDYVGAHLEEAVFVLETFYTEEYRDFCTLFHEASKKYLAVDGETQEPIVRCLIRSPVSGSPVTDFPLRKVLGPEPLAPDESDASSASAVAVSAYRLDPCCFFDVPLLNRPTYLKPKLCENKSLSYQKTGQVTVVTIPCGEDFVVHPS